jgi:hypothetical protein
MAVPWTRTLPHQQRDPQTPAQGDDEAADLQEARDEQAIAPGRGIIAVAVQEDAIQALSAASGAGLRQGELQIQRPHGDAIEVA